VIILRDVPFDRRAKFMHDSMAILPGADSLTAALEPAGGAGDVAGLVGGLEAAHALWKRIYADPAGVEGKDDLDRQSNLVASMMLLHAVFSHGSLTASNGAPQVEVEKDLLKTVYKKGAFRRRKRHLARHGLELDYLLDGSQYRSLSKATHVAIRFPLDDGLVPALKRFADAAADLSPPPTQKAPVPLIAFMRANFGAAFLGAPTPRHHLDPLDPAILNTVGVYRGPWTDLARRLRDGCELGVTGFWTYGASGAWGVSFAAGRKRPMAMFTLASDIVFIEFTLPVDHAEPIILARRGYSHAIRERIEQFHCVKCPKACKGANLLDIDGVKLCTGRAEARRIYAPLETPEDFGSIHAMLDIIFVGA